jgi:hypothetical protein
MQNNSTKSQLGAKVGAETISIEKLGCMGRCVASKECSNIKLNSSNPFVLFF